MAATHSFTNKWLVIQNLQEVLDEKWGRTLRVLDDSIQMEIPRVESTPLFHLNEHITVGIERCTRRVGFCGTKWSSVRLNRISQAQSI